MQAILNVIIVLLIFLAGCKENVSEKTAVMQSEKAAADDMLALTPPMGWNSWNPFGKNVK